MQAIITKYLPATDYREARIKATCSSGSVTILYPHELSGQAVHRAAAEALVAKLFPDLKAPLLGGGLPDGRTVFVFDHPFSKE